LDIEAWLRGLGLEHYAQAFRDNAIDGEILPKLTADDLKDIGVTIVGHRRKMLEAIAALRAVNGPAPPLSAGRSGSMPPARPKPLPDGEERPYPAATHDRRPARRDTWPRLGRSAASASGPARR
jgi:hypothetical protein